MSSGWALRSILGHRRHWRLYSTFPNPFPFPSKHNPTPLEIFHLAQNADGDAVKERYYELVRIYHPDKVDKAVVPPDVAHTRFRMITTAYKSLRGKTLVETAGTEDARPSAANYRAMYIYRRRKLYDGPDEQWKDQVFFFGVIAAIAVFVAQMTAIRHQAMTEMITLPTSSNSSRVEQELGAEHDRLSATE